MEAAPQRHHGRVGRRYRLISLQRKWQAMVPTRCEYSSCHEKKLNSILFLVEAGHHRMGCSFPRRRKKCPIATWLLMTQKGIHVHMMMFVPTTGPADSNIIRQRNDAIHCFGTAKQMGRG